MDTNEILINGFLLSVGFMIVLISIISFSFMIMYQVRKKVKVNNYVKFIILIGFIIGIALIFISCSKLDFSIFGL